MKLNQEQQRAVSQMDGPMKVLAGPGSGKTTVIVEKVANLVKNGVPEESILCMTFTGKAADEMSNRLSKRGIHNVWVGTMHSLCLDILKENALTTGISDRTTVFSDTARLAWCVRNIHRIDIDTDVVNLDKNPRGVCANILESIRLAKREIISMDKIQEYVKTGDPDTSKKLAQVAKVYDAYSAHMKDSDIIDYEDMVASVVKYLQADGRMLDKYAERYRYVLVDEFQDNNYAQFLLAKLLAQSGNLTVVGDDDQSIMGFQGAFSGIFEEFDAEYPNAESVTLKTNYRCSEHIANRAASLLEADSSRKSKHMNTPKTGGNPVKAVAAANEAAERQFVAETIQNMKIPYGKVAILCKTNDACRDVAATLRLKGIPTALMSPGSLGRSATAAEVLALLRIADSPDTSGTDISYMLKLRGISEYNIRAINDMARQYKKKNPDTSKDGVMECLGKSQGLDQNIQIQEVGERLHKMAEAARSADLLDTLHDIMFRYTDAYKKNANEQTPDAARNLTILNGIYDVAKDYVRHYPHERLSDFIEYLNIADEQTLNEVIDAEDADAVSVMTIHKSKGKEFDTVFVTGLYDGQIPGKRRPAGFEIPASLLSGKGRGQDPDMVHTKEMRNLLYVAMTRAENMLYLTYPRKVGDSPKERMPSKFLKDMHITAYEEFAKVAEHAPMIDNRLDAELYNVQEMICKAVRECRPDAAILGMVEMAHILHVINDKEGAFEPAHILDMGTAYNKKQPGREKMPLVNQDTLTLSATKIQTYQQCPLKFKYRDILRMPEKPAMALHKGGAAHAALEWAAKERMAGRHPDVEGMEQVAKNEMKQARSMFSDAEYHTAASSMKGMMEWYAKWEAGSKNTLEAVEKKFRIRINNIQYSGKIDRIEKNPRGEYEVVDYKTGKSAETKKNVPKLPQANIYAAGMRALYGSLPSKFSLVYIEKQTTREYDVTEQSLKAGLEIVEECAGDIVKERFEPKPGFHCKWCPYRDICPAMSPE